MLLYIEKQAIIQMILQKLGSVIGSKIKDWRNDVSYPWFGPVLCIFMCISYHADPRTLYKGNK